MNEGHAVRLIHLAITFIVLTAVLVVILDTVVPSLLATNPVLGLYAVIGIMIMYALCGFILAKLSRKTT